MPTLFDELVKNGEAAIAQLKEDRRQETVDLEFKTKADSTNGQLYPNDKLNLAKALSAFSNSAGGTLIFGINAQKNDEGIDCATDLEPITEIERFQSESHELLVNS